VQADIKHDQLKLFEALIGRVLFFKLSSTRVNTEILESFYLLKRAAIMA
jgi:hypothetical protein